MNRFAMALLILSFPCLLPSPAAAVGDCFDYETLPPPWTFGRASLPGTGNRLALSDRFAYVAAGSWGLQIVDLWDLQAPVLRGGLDLPRFVWDVAVEGSHVFVADDDLQVVDVASSDEPRVVGGLVIDGQTQCVAVAGGLACLGGGGGLAVVDVSEPTAPVQLGHLALAETVVDVAIQGNHAFLASLSEGLKIVDLTDPAAPVLVGGLSVSADNVFAVAVQGDVVCMGTSMRVHVVDVSDPAAPSILGSGGVFDVVNGIAINGSLVHAATTIRGLLTFDVTDPAAPAEVFRPESSTSVGDVAIRDGFAITVSGSRLDVTSYGSADDPLPDTRHAALDGEPRDAAWWGDHAFLACIDHGLRVAALDAGGTPVPVGSLALAGSPSGVCVEDGLAYVSCGSFLSLVDVSLPAAPAQVSWVTLTRGAADAVVAGGYAYVAGSLGFSVVDVSDPATAQYSGGIYGTADRWGQGVDLAGSFAYVAGGDGLKVIDVADPSTPRLVGQLTAGSEGFDVTVADEVAYYADGADGLLVIDVSDPLSPIVLSSLDVNGFAVAVERRDDTLLVADYEGGLRVVDVSDPAAPVMVGGYRNQAVTWGVAPAGERLLLADVNGLRTLPVPCGGDADCDGDGMADWLQLRLRPSADWNGDGVLDNCQQDQGVTAVADTGVKGLRCAAHPNPFNARTLITFDSPREASGRVYVFDLKGRLVRRLLDDDPVRQGRNEVVWDGCDEGGRPLATGVYSLRVVIAGWEAQGRVLLVK